jgi:hypothetical protein
MGQKVPGIDGGKRFGNEVCLRGDMNHAAAIFPPLVDVA